MIDPLGPSRRPVTSPTLAPARLRLRAVQSVQPIAVTGTIIPAGAIGTVIATAGDDIEVAFYSPRDVVVITSASRVQVT